MKEKEALFIELSPQYWPSLGEIIDLLLNWYRQHQSYKNISDTEYVLKLWGRIDENNETIA